MDKYIDAYNSMGSSGFELIDFIFNIWSLEMLIESNSSKSWSLARKYQDQAEPIESKVAK